ncbi:polysaccharide biosynthesis tyrosine autokinase [uncultured Nonlabens sp.]|uniref:GumC family protein n=1 Tax=uncultured Nonlabens sp. TaxID=859306 RepID=UPI0030D7AB70|tara:strand:- start:7467 stop:9872 length:2406 start_codon:yes stop_codon:yes gene_type:complete
MNNTNFEADQNVSLKDEIYQYLRHWPWFLLSIIIFLSIGYTYLRYTTRQYQASSKILIKDTERGGGLSELSALGDLDVLGGSFNSVENEMQILQSNRLISQVVENLDLNIVYSRIGNIKSTNIYKNSPIKATLLNKMALYTAHASTSFVVKNIDSESFGIKYLDGDYTNYSYGSEFEINGVKLLILPKSTLESTIKEEVAEAHTEWDEISITIQPAPKTAKSIVSRLRISKIDTRGSVLELSIIDPVKEKAEDILNNLVVVFNKDAIKDKNEVSRNTARFIDERLAAIRKDLDSLERGIQRFKISESVTDIIAEATLNLESSSIIGREVVVAGTQLRIAKLMKSEIDVDSFNFIPQNMGLKDDDLEQTTFTYNTLLQEYLNFKENATSENPVLKRLVDQLNSLKQSIILSLNNIINSMSIQQESLIKELNKVSGKISDIPENERINRDIERDRVVVEAVYLLLNQKRETTAISLAVTAPKAKIVDFALASATPISPKSKIIYLAMLVLGTLIPVAVVYGRSIFYNKIESRTDVERGLPNITILGEVPKLDKDSSDYIQMNDRSILAESFRILRTNLQYKLNAVQHDNTKVVLVTSTVKGEGKTLIAFNLANTFSYSGKKVLLIGADIRNPQLHRYSDTLSKRTPGVTEFLTDDSLKLKDLTITSSVNKNLDIILSGAIPPNPAELWMQDRTKTLFDEAKENYDVVIVDSAPTILVTDTLLINKYADVTTYVTRANYTDTSLLQFVADTIKEGKLSNVAIVVNNVKLTNFGYGNKYGYAYGEEKKTFWSAFKSKFQKKRSFK